MSFDEIYEGSVKEGKEPVKIFQQAYDGAVIAVSYAEILLNRAIRKYGEERSISYPDTAYYLPVIRALSGEEVTKLGDLPPILNRMRCQVKSELNFENARLAGEATLYAAEIIEVLKYFENEAKFVEPWTGFLSDPVLRKYGVKMVDWTIPGEAVIIGRAKSSQHAKKLVDELMGKGFMLFLCDEIIEQLLEENVKLGVDYIAFPLGNFTQVIHAPNYALRAGMSFGNVEPGKREEQRDYQRRRIRAFVLQLGERDEVKTAAELGAIFLGFPVITDQELDEEEIIPEWYVSEPDYDNLIKTATEIRGIKLDDVDLDIPVNYGPAFEGETIRKDDMYVEMGGGRTTAFELVRMAEKDEVEDNKVELIGPDIEDIEEGEKLPLGIECKIFGRKMQEDFEGVLERRLHQSVNFAEGIWHVGQRDMNWVRLSKEAVEKGFVIKDLGKLLLAKFKEEFPSIVDRVEITLYTNEEDVKAQKEKAQEYYTARDKRMGDLTDDSVDTFYSCLLCQSFAPNHVCIITPERLGLCGALSWLDGKASYEIDNTGPNQPVEKGECLDEVKGEWEGVNEYLKIASNEALDCVKLYSLVDNPMTSCGCFEAIVAIIPEANGIMITTREHSGETPCGMTFSTLAGMVGGGIQTPGFMGIGRKFVISKKFISAEGGISRIVWMPKELKEFLGEEFIRRCEEDGLGEDFIEKIADETVGTTVDEILPFLEEKEHPAFSMDPLM